MVGLVGVEAKLRAQLQRCSRERDTRVKRQESSQVQESVTPCSRESRERETRESSAKSQAKFKRASRHVPESRERDLQLARCFSTVQLAPPHGRLVESDGSYGAEPRPCPGLLGGPTVL